MTKIESFFLGALIAAAALVTEIFFANTLLIGKITDSEYTSVNFFNENSFNYLFISFIFIEEIFKFIGAYRISQLVSKKNILKNSLIAGLGFSSFESVLIFFNYSAYAEASLVSVFQIFILHTLLFGLLGFFLATSKTAHSAFWKGLPLVIFIHFYFNLLLYWNNPFTDLIIFSLLSLLVLATFINIRRVHKLAY